MFWPKKCLDWIEYWINPAGMARERDRDTSLETLRIRDRVDVTARATPFATDRDARGSVSLRGRLSNLLARHHREATIHVPPSAAVVSFTFDDVPECAATIGAALLEDRGFRGTFYVSSGLAGTRNSYWTNADHRRIAALARNGHEIGCHTLDHPIMPDLPSEALSRSIADNRRALRDLAGVESLETFAYPFGYSSIRVKRLVRRSFMAGRGVNPGINKGVSDRYLLKAVPLTGRSYDGANVSRAVAELAAGGGWLIFYTHDVRREPSPYGCTPALLERTITSIDRLGIPCRPVGHVLSESMRDRSDHRRSE